MVKRCDSVDALMYAYYEMMRIKEGNRMLKKNENYVEFTLQYTSVDWAVRSKDYPEVCLKGYSDFSFPGVPIMDVVCNEFDHKVVVVSKRDFDRLQADDQHYRELAKQREENYKALLDKTGFYNLADLMCYLPKDKTLKDIIDGLAAENEQLKQKLHEFDPIPEFKELLKKLYSTEDVEELKWVLNHTCGGRGSVNGWIAVSLFWKQNFESLSKLVGFSSVEEIQDYLTNEAECDTLHEAISKLHDQVKYTCDEWGSANSNNNSWKAAAECNSPKELIEKREALEKEIEVYSRALNEWKEVTGCPSPSVAKTLIESGASWMSAYHSSCEVIKTWKKLTGSPTPIAAKTLIESGMAYEHGFHEEQEENRKLTEEVDSWKNVTGYSTPEDYMHARISGALHTPFDYTAAWKTATKCDTPDQVKSRIEGLENAVRLTNKNMLKELENNIDEWQKFTGCDSPQKAGCKINNLCDEICKLKGDYDHLLKLTGYKTEQDIRVLLNDSEQFVYEDMRELINSLKRKDKFTESNWQGVTGFSTPEKCSSYIDRLEKKLEDIKNLTEED